MRAVCKIAPEPGVTLIDAPAPSVDRGDVLIAIRAASICGTDRHIYNWDPWAAKRLHLPLIFGHECAGEVADIGEGVTKVKTGDHVSIETHIPTLEGLKGDPELLHLSPGMKIVGIDRPGAFAEYLSIPEICCVKNSPDLPWNIASIKEPLGNAVYCVDESDVRGKSIAIFGDGPIGIFAVAVARALDAQRIIACGMQRYRLEMMRSFGPDEVIDVKQQNPKERILELTKGKGVDVVLEMSGSKHAIHDGLAVVRNGGLLTLFGVPSKPIEIDVAEEIIFKGITIKSIVGRRMFATWNQMAELLDSGKLDVSRVITHEFSLEKIDEAMALLNGEEVKAGKIVLKP